MDTDCNALYRYSIRHRVATWKERGEEEGKGRRERDPDRESQTNLISCSSSPLPPVLVICTDQFETYGRKAPSPNYPSILDLYTRAINPVEKKQAHVDILFGHPSIEKGRGEEIRCWNSRDLRTKHSRDVQTYCNACQSQLVGVGWTSANSLPILSADAYLWTAERRRYNGGWIDKGRSGEEKQEARRMLAPRSIIGNGNKQGPPTLLVTLPQPKGGYMHLALMNCHEHLPAQKLFAKLHVREQLSFRSLSFSIIEVRGLRTASVLLNDINNSFPPFLFFFFLSPHLRIYFLFVRCARLNPSILDIEEFLSIDPAIVRDIGYCCSPMCSRLSQDRFSQVRSSHNAPPVAPYYYFSSFPLATLVHIFANLDHRTFCIITPPTLFSHNGPFLSRMRQLLGGISFRKYSVGDKKEIERARKTKGKHSCQDLVGIFPWGNSNVTVYTSIISFYNSTYPLLCLAGERVDILAWHCETE